MQLSRGLESLKNYSDHLADRGQLMNSVRIDDAIFLLERMAEALELITGDLINSDLGGLEEGRKVLKQFKEWK